jgi:hypothetical protein
VCWCDVWSATNSIGDEVAVAADLLALLRAGGGRWLWLPLVPLIVPVGSKFEFGHCFLVSFDRDGAVAVLGTTAPSRGWMLGLVL